MKTGTGISAATWTVHRGAAGPDCFPGVLCRVTEKKAPRDFPGGPVAKTPRSQCRGPAFDPWSGN